MGEFLISDFSFLMKDGGYSEFSIAGSYFVNVLTGFSADQSGFHYQLLSPRPLLTVFC